MYNYPIGCKFMAALRVKLQEKQRILTDQNAKDVAQYLKARNNLERQIAHYGNFVAFLDIKGIVYNNQDIVHRTGDYKSHALNTKLVFVFPIFDQTITHI